MITFTYHSSFDISVSSMKAACTCEVNFCCTVHNPDLDIHDGHELKLVFHYYDHFQNAACQHTYNLLVCKFYANKP